MNLLRSWRICPSYSYCYEQIFNDFLHTEYGGPGTLLVLPFIDMADTLTERGLPGAPQAARAAVKWAQNHVDKDWKAWLSGSTSWWWYERASSSLFPFWDICRKVLSELKKPQNGLCISSFFPPQWSCGTNHMYFSSDDSIFTFSIHIKSAMEQLYFRWIHL